MSMGPAIAVGAVIGLALGIVGGVSLSGGQSRLPGSMERGSVGELLDVTVERPVLDQLQVEVGRTLEDRVQPGLTGDDRK
jgi:hypothetical protein